MRFLSHGFAAAPTPEATVTDAVLKKPKSAEELDRWIGSNGQTSIADQGKMENH